jgi:hypothetical protein
VVGALISLAGTRSSKWEFVADHCEEAAPRVSLARSRMKVITCSELEDPVKKTVDDKLNDPFIATKKGEREAVEELKKGVQRSSKRKN